MGVATTSSPDHRPGPMETKLRAHPEPVGLCFGAYGEASQGVHDLIKVVAEAMAEEKYKAEIEREMQSSDEDEELTGNTLGEDADDDGDDVDRDERTEGRMPEIAGALHNASCAALALRRLERRLAVACLCCSP